MPNESTTKEKPENPTSKAGNDVGKESGGVRTPDNLRQTDEACCCDHITLYLSDFTVLTETDAPIPVPGLSSIVGFFTDDHMAIRVTSCDGTIKHYPTSQPSLKVHKGNKIQIDEPVATVKPGNGCHVSCSIKVEVFRASRASDILEAINKLLSKVPAALAAIQAASGPIGALSKVAASLTGIAAAQKQFDDLMAELKNLEIQLTDAKDALMGEFYVNFEGSLACTATLKSAVEKPDDASAVTDDEVAIHRTIRNFNGEWELNLRAKRSCPAKTK